MPAWSFHIKVANDIAKILEYNNEEKKLFILSNLIPDIKSGYLFPVETTIESKYSHYYNLNTDIRLPDLEEYEKKYLKNDIVSIGIYCHICLDYYLNALMNEKYFIFDKNGKIIGIRILNSIKYGNREYCLKIKHKNLSKIAKWINVETEYNFPKNNIKIKIDSTIQNGSYIITEKDIELTEDWLSNNYKNTQLEFPKNELFTEENIDKFFINAEKFILKKLKQHLL